MITSLTVKKKYTRYTLVTFQYNVYMGSKWWTKTAGHSSRKKSSLTNIIFQFPTTDSERHPSNTASYTYFLGRHTPVSVTKPQILQIDLKITWKWPVVKIKSSVKQTIDHFCVKLSLCLGQYWLTVHSYGGCLNTTHRARNVVL